MEGIDQVTSRVTKIGFELHQVARASRFEGKLMNLAGTHEEKRMIANGVWREVDFMMPAPFFRTSIKKKSWR